MSGIDDRKNEHIDVCLTDEVESGRPAGLDDWRLSYRALPEVALDEVDLATSIAGKTLAAPLIIGAMTGGTRRAGELNRVLAEAAERTRIGFALGSGRIVLERPRDAGQPPEEAPPCRLAVVREGDELRPRPPAAHPAAASP